MLIHANYKNGRYDYVKEVTLDNLIKVGDVAKFQRRSGWATIGVDPLRSSAPDGGYSGNERRGSF